MAGAERPGMLKVWGYKESFNCQKVLWALGELGVEYELIPKGGQFGGNDDPAYRALNPNGRVPTIDDNGFVLWESNAIVRYLAEKFDFGGLCPRDAQVRADADRWMTWQQTTIGADMRGLIISLFRTLPEKRDPALVSRQIAAVANHWQLVDRHLAGRSYLTGEIFNMGDIPLGAYVSRWYKMDIERPKFGNLEAWYKRLCTRAPYRVHALLEPAKAA